MAGFLAGLSLAGLSLSVIPAYAGIQSTAEKMDTRLRGYDEWSGF